MSLIYTITDRLVDMVSVILITEGEFKDVEFTFGGVSVDEEDDQVRLKFDYNLVNDSATIYHKERLENLIGDILSDIIYDQLDKNEVIYKGGK